MKESEVLFQQRLMVGEALVWTSAGDFDHPKLFDVLESIDFPRTVFEDLMRLEHPMSTGLMRNTIFARNEGGKTLAEDNMYWLAETVKGMVKVEDGILFPEGIRRQRPGWNSMRPQGFEAIYGLMGQATIVFPSHKEAILGESTVSEEDSVGVVIKRGSLVVITHPMKYRWGVTPSGFEFRRIKMPVERPDLVTSA